MIAFLLRTQAHGARFGFAGSQAPRGWLDPVVDRIADQVHERIGKRFDEIAVEFGVGADDVQLDRFAELSRNIAREFREAREHPSDRLHPRGHHRRLKPRRRDVEHGDGAMEFFIVQARADRLQAITREDEFADQIDHGVQATHVDPDRRFGFARRVR